MSVCVTCGHAEHHTCPLFTEGYEPRYYAIPKTKFLAGAYFVVEKLGYPCYITFGEWESAHK
jgi:hypothetical protein